MFKSVYRSQRSVLYKLILTNYIPIRSFNQSYMFINDKTNVESLVYKEQIFEYFGYNYEKMTEKELKILFDKLKVMNILESEYREIKFFFRNFFEICVNLTDKELIGEFLEYFMKMWTIIAEFVNSERNSEYDVYDMDMNNLIMGAIRFVQSHINYLNKKELDLVFKFWDMFQVNESWVEIVNRFKTNEAFEKASLEDTAFVIKCVLNAYDKDYLKEIDIVSYTIANYLIKLASNNHVNNYRAQNTSQHYVNILHQLNKVISDILLKDKQNSTSLLKSLDKAIKRQLIQNKVFWKIKSADKQSGEEDSDLLKPLNDLSLLDNIKAKYNV